MHDIGRAAMVMATPQSYALVVEQEADEPQDLLARERELFGIDHCQAGASLVKTWNLPSAFLEVTAHHHECAPPARGTASVIAPSCRLADALGFAVGKYRTAPTYADLVGAFSESARRRFPPDANAVVAEITDEIRVIEGV